MKKKVKIHTEDEPRQLYQASRLEGKVKNAGIKPEKKKKKAEQKSHRSAK